MSIRRVVITGIGALTPSGNNVEKTWENLAAGKSCITRIDRFDVSDLPVQIAGEIKNFNAEDFMDKKLASRMDRFAQYGFIAANEAVQDSHIIEYRGLDKRRVGVLIGSGIGGMQSLYENAQNHLERGYRRVSPLFVPMSILDIISGYVAIEYGFMGPNYAVTSACATGSHSLMTAFNHIRLGDADIVVAGGAECTLTPLGLSGFIQARALSTHFNNTPEKASRPFDKDRDGFVMAEGAGIMVLEEYEHAVKRGANIYGEFIGYGATADAYHITAPHPNGEGAGLAMKHALTMSGLKPEDIDLINTHGTSTPLGDIAETQAVKFAFGEEAYRVKLNSTKSMIGHTLGAAGAIEGIAILKMMEHNLIHPTINIDQQDPECDLDYTPNKAQKHEVNFAMSNSFGFGGHNVSVIFKKV